MTKYHWLIKDIKRYIPKFKNGIINMSQIARLISLKRNTPISRQLVSLHISKML